MKAKKFIRKDILRIRPYTPESLFPPDLEAEVAKLDLNENFNVEHDFIQGILRDAAAKVDARFYPHPYAEQAVKSIADFLGMSPNKIFIGKGIDGVLEKVTRAFVGPNTRVGIVEPTFPMYSYFTQLCGGKKIAIRLGKDFSLDIRRLLGARRRFSLLFVCSPNNPTCNQFPEADMRTILEGFEGPVIVDEAYSDFAKYSLIKWLDEFDHLLVLRTFSKLFGLAGMRAGYLASAPEIIDYVRRACPPFDVDAMTQQVIITALERWSYFRDKITQIINEREWLREELNEIDGVIAYPSDASFLLIRITKAKRAVEVAETLKAAGVLVKVREDDPILRNCVRIAVGNRTMNEKLLNALSRALGGN